MLDDFEIRALSGNKYTVRIANPVGRITSRNRLDVDFVNGNAVLFATKAERYDWGSDSAGLDYIHNACHLRADWVDDKLKYKPVSQAFTPNNVIMVEDQRCMLTINNDYTKAGFSRFETSQGFKRIYAPAKGFAGHVKKLLQDQAMRTFRIHCDRYVDTLTDIWRDEWSSEYLANSRVRRYHKEYDGVQYNNIEFLRDDSKNWGDCWISPSEPKKHKRVRFDWKIISANPKHMEYIAAHEMSHLLEMNHSSKFYAIVGECLGRDGRDADTSFDQGMRFVKRYGSTSPLLKNLKITNVDYVNS